jgi:hypothetical protein
MRSDQLKRMAINVMIGSLIGAAGIAVVAILVGEFNDVLGRALFTLGIVTLHALVCLAFLDRRGKLSDPDELQVFTNTIFILIVLSFITAVFGIWELLPGEVIAKLYGTYFIVAFATLHSEMLHKTTGLDSTINRLVFFNYASMAVVVGLLLPLIWLASAGDFPDFYFRLLAAVAIIDATLTILAVILHRLYLQKHPRTESQLFISQVNVVDANGNVVPQQHVEIRKKGMHPLLIILIIFLGLQFLAPIVFLLGSFFVR